MYICYWEDMQATTSLPMAVINGVKEGAGNEPLLGTCVAGRRRIVCTLVTSLGNKQNIYSNLMSPGCC